MSAQGCSGSANPDVGIASISRYVRCQDCKYYAAEFIDLATGGKLYLGGCVNSESDFETAL